MREAGKKKVGRPDSYDYDKARSICVRIANGELLKNIIKDRGMPNHQTVYDWMVRHPEFAELYTRAREEQADTFADEIVALADETPELVPVLDKDGNEVGLRMDSAYIQWQRNRVDARKWVAAKLKPRKYSERTMLAGDAENPVKVEQDFGVFKDLLAGLQTTRHKEV
jgi:hypothetical protein